MSDAAQGFAGLVGFVVIAAAFFALGICACGRAWEDSAKSRGVMRYNESTGVLEWTVERKERNASR